MKLKNRFSSQFKHRVTPIYDQRFMPQSGIYEHKTPNIAKILNSGGVSQNCTNVRQSKNSDNEFYNLELYQIETLPVLDTYPELDRIMNGS